MQIILFKIIKNLMILILKTVQNQNHKKLVLWNFNNSHN